MVRSLVPSPTSAERRLGVRAAQETAKSRVPGPDGKLPSSRSRVPPPGRAWPLPHRYSRLRRPSHRLSPPSASASPGESGPLPTSPGCRWTFPRYLGGSFPGCPVPYDGGPTGCIGLFLPPVIGLPNRGLGRPPASPPNTNFPRSVFRGCRHSLRFRPLSTSWQSVSRGLAHLPDRSYRCAYSRRAAEIFTSGHRRASLPPHTPDMVTARIQAIGGTGTLNPQIRSRRGRERPGP